MPLTSFKTILLDCIVTAVISMCIILKLIKIGQFCVVILILKLEGKKQHFWHIMLYYFKKAKNIAEMQKEICTMYGEVAMTDQTCQKWVVKFCAGDFSLDDAHGLVDQLKLIMIKLRH